MSLMEEFLRNLGAPVKIGSREVVQMDRIPIHNGIITVRFRCAAADNGVALKAASGKIFLSDGRHVPLLHIWNELHLPLNVTHVVSCPNKELRIWNIYRSKHPDGSVTEDAWTGNAGMIVEMINSAHRRYRCSNGTGAFDPSFEFEIKWRRQ